MKKLTRGMKTGAIIIILECCVQIIQTETKQKGQKSMKETYKKKGGDQKFKRKILTSYIYINQNTMGWEIDHDTVVKLSYTMSIFHIIAGITFIVGSVVYWPSIADDFDPALGGILFIIGSCLFVISDSLGALVEPRFSPFKPFRNLGALRAFLLLLGNISFIVGSVYFLPNEPAIVGDNIFIIASIFIWVPQILTCWGLFTVNPFTAQYYYAFSPFKQTLIAMNVMYAIGALFFFVGSVLFRDEESQSIGLYEEGIGMFIAGSALFLFGAIAGLLNKRKRLHDPLHQYHEELKSSVTSTLGYSLTSYSKINQ